MSVVILLMLLLVFFLYQYMNCNREGLSNKLDEKEKPHYVKQILHGRSSFSSLDKAKEKLDWMDPVLYEDARKLIDENKFNEKNINLILS